MTGMTVPLSAMTDQELVDEMFTLAGHLDAARAAGGPCEAILDKLQATADEERVRALAAHLAATDGVSA